MFLPLIILAAAVTFAVVIISVLYWDEIEKWFNSWSSLYNSSKKIDTNDVGFTLVDKIGKGEYKTVQGVFNKHTNKVKDGRVIKSKQIDQKLAEIHGNKELVIYE